MPVDDFSISVLVQPSVMSHSPDRTIFAAWAGASDKSFAFGFASGEAKLLMAYSVDGSTSVAHPSTVVLPQSDNDKFYVKVYRNGTTVQYFTAPFPFTSWTQLGANITIAESGDFFGTVGDIEIGASSGGTATPLDECYVYEVDVHTGNQAIQKYHFDVSDSPSLSNSTWASTGTEEEVWTANGAIMYNSTNLATSYGFGENGNIEMAAQQNVTGPMTILAAVRPTFQSTPGTNRHFADSLDGNFSLTNFVGATGWSAYRGGTVIVATGEYTKGLTHYILEAPAAANSTLRTEGVGGSQSIVSGDVGTDIYGMGKLYAHVTNNASSSFHGSILEYLVWDSALSEPDIQAVITYLEGKWGDGVIVALPPATPAVTTTPAVTPTPTPTTPP